MSRLKIWTFRLGNIWVAVVPQNSLHIVTNPVSYLFRRFPRSDRPSNEICRVL
ncbi:hypothetical protein [Nostoc sp. TCL240-02]|uniref:hypothetical protein n=1 Tax=Nostoc sp. TCL240-02 TaxID=2572090 RepID=UPI00157F97C0|nr:hypothetical protein [Nostoc sp. TCL240-02]